MNTTSFRSTPPAARASRTLSSIGRPRIGTRVFGISSVKWWRRLPRPAPMMTAFTSSSDVVRAVVELLRAVLLDAPDAELVAALRQRARVVAVRDDALVEVRVRGHRGIADRRAGIGDRLRAVLDATAAAAAAAHAAAPHRDARAAAELGPPTA